MTIEDLIADKTVIPVLKIARLEDAVPLAEALIEGGLTVLEITLRTPCALDAVKAVKTAFPGATVGVGTIMTADDMIDAAMAGADFGVSPGLTRSLGEAARKARLPYLPGVATVSEAIAAREGGYRLQKAFPIKTLGGLSCLKAWGDVLGDVRFCPTGGVGPDDYGDYLALHNVFAVGGSWIAPEPLVAAGDWPAISALARAACSGGKPS